MKLTSAALPRHLKDAPTHHYLCINEEPVLLNEDRDRIRTTLACEDRTLYLVETGFDFAEVAGTSMGGNLFGETVLLEFICSDPLNAAIAAKFSDLAAMAGDDVALLIGCPGLAKWGKWTAELENSFVVVNADDVPPERTLNWVQARAKRMRLQLDDEAAELIASMTEGNLSMAAQELEKLALIHGNDTQIDYAMARDSSTDLTRDSISSLREAMAAGNTIRTLRALRNLRAEQAAIPIVVWALAEEGRALLALIHKGRPWGLFGTHRRNLQDLARRTNPAAVQQWLAHVAKADWAAKGLSRTDPWIICERLATAFTLLARHGQLNRNLLVA